MANKKPLMGSAYPNSECIWLYADPHTRDLTVSETDFKNMDDAKKIDVVVATFRKWFTDEGWLRLGGGSSYIAKKLRFIVPKPDNAYQDLYGEFFPFCTHLMDEIEKRIDGLKSDKWFYTGYSLRQNLWIIKEKQIPRNTLESYFLETDILKILINEGKMSYWDYSHEPMMMYSHAFSLFESFIYEIFIDKLLDNKILQSRYAQTFCDKKYKLSEILEDNFVEQHIKQNFAEKSLHNIAVLKNLADKILEVNIPEISDLSPYVEKRHNIIHRAGKNIENEYVGTYIHEVMALIELMENIAEKFYTSLYPQNSQ